MKTKDQEGKELELRKQLEEVSSRIVEINEKIDRLTTNKLSKLRWLVDERTKLESKQKALVNLLNIIS